MYVYWFQQIITVEEHPCKDYQLLSCCLMVILGFLHEFSDFAKCHVDARWAMVYILDT